MADTKVTHTDDVVVHERATGEDAARFAAPAVLGRYQFIAFVVGLIGIAAAIIGMFLLPGDLRHLMFAYLTSFVFWSGITLGSLGLLCLSYVARGAWGVTIRRILEASIKTLPLMFLLFIPILADMWIGHGGHIFHWAHPEVMNPRSAEYDEILAQKLPYLTPLWFTVRWVLMFGIWGIFAYLLVYRWSPEQDRTGAPGLHRMFRYTAGPALVFFAIAVTFASVDWIMSLDPHWYSTIFGFLFMGGWALSAMSFTILALLFLSRFEPMRSVLTKAHFHDLGKFLLAFTMLWTYFSLSQFLIIWSANLPEEIPWYLRRMSGGWEFVGLAIFLFAFALPFLLLLSRQTKRTLPLLGTIAVLVIVMRLVDTFYYIAPEANRSHAKDAITYIGQLHVSLPYIAMPIGIGGLWLALFLWNLRRLPLLPINDPLLPRTLTHGHGHHH